MINVMILNLIHNAIHDMNQNLTYYMIYCSIQDMIQDIMYDLRQDKKQIWFILIYENWNNIFYNIWRTFILRYFERFQCDIKANLKRILSLQKKEGEWKISTEVD